MFKMFSPKASRSGQSAKSAAATTVGDFQRRLAEEGELIISEKFVQKIAELDELCIKEEYRMSRIKDVREITTQAIDKYFADEKAAEEQQKGKQPANPLLQLLGGSLSGLGTEADEEGEEEGETEEGPLPKKLLLDRLALDSSNKINLKFSLELETPESKKRERGEDGEKKEESSSAENGEESESEPAAKKAKKAKAGSKEEKDAGSDEKESDAKKEEEEEEIKPVIPSHSINKEFATMLRLHIDEIVDWCTTIRAWIQSNTSRNKNIGGADLKGEMQAETLVEIQTVEQELLNHKEIMAAYYVARAGILEKYVKSPEFEDYKVFIIDEDEKQFIALRSIVLQMRNQTLSLYESIKKDSDDLFSSGPSDKNDSFGGFAMY